MLRRFDVHRATSLTEAIELRGRFGDDAALYAGGTELLMVMKMGVARWGHLIDVKPIADLQRLSLEDGTLRIGAAVTHWTLERDRTVAQKLPAFADLESRVANIRVRAAGTLGGNLAFAEPHADPPTLLTALDARVILQSGRGQRTLALSDFITGMYQTSLAADEILVAIEVPIPAADVRVAYVKFQILERPSVGVAMVASLRDGRFVGAPKMVVGAVDEVPRRIETDQLSGADASDPRTAEALAEAASRSVDPGTDLAGSAEYKRHLVGVFTRRALASLMAEAA